MQVNTAPASSSSLAETHTFMASTQNISVSARSKTQKAAAHKIGLEQTELTRQGRMATSGTFCGTAVVEAFQGNLLGKTVGLDPIYASLTERVKLVNAGDLIMVESMLFSQAQALQTIFSSLARRASSQEHLKQYQVFLTLALKAQTQSRATLEALIELKQPRHRATFVKQANIAAGHQQVNNSYAGASAHTTSLHAEDSSTEPNKLLEATHGIELDIGAQGTASSADPHLEAVGAVNRTAHP